MEGSKSIIEGNETLPCQEFNGHNYYLYKGERYFSRGRSRLHRKVWEFYNGKIPNGYHIHHVDNNPHNNDISNLNIVAGTLHLRFSAKQTTKNNPEWRKEFHAKGIEAAKEWHKSEEGRAWHREHGKQCWINKPYFTYKCKECGKEFKTKSNIGSSYCHNNCKAKAYRKKCKLEGKSLRYNH